MYVIFEYEYARPVESPYFYLGSTTDYGTEVKRVHKRQVGIHLAKLAASLVLKAAATAQPSDDSGSLQFSPAVGAG